MWHQCIEHPLKVQTLGDFLMMALRNMHGKQCNVPTLWSVVLSISALISKMSFRENATMQSPGCTLLYPPARCCCSISSSPNLQGRQVQVLCKHA